MIDFVVDDALNGTTSSHSIQLLLLNTQKPLQ